MPVAPTPYWIAFHGALLVLLAVELVFSRWGLSACVGERRLRRQRNNAIAATVLWTVAAFVLAGLLLRIWGAGGATQFLAGYAIEESLSIDNLFVFLLLFRIFQIPETYQPRVLFWGVLGAIVMRGSFIAGGISLLERFHWIGYAFALILLAASIRLMIPSREHHPDTSTKLPVWVRWISRIHPVSLRSDVFVTREATPGDGAPRRMVTMLFLALVAIEAADIVFAVDSIPAVLSITRNAFIAYTSNILAVMGLRSLYFLLSGMFHKLRYLDRGLAAVLSFAAAKMLIAPWYEIGPLASLGTIVAVLAVTIAASLRVDRSAASASA